MELMDMGNAVKIGDTIVPAMNIQVENVPGYLEFDRLGVHTCEWYGVYFEVMFETGEHLVVQQRWAEHMDDIIQVEIFNDWASWKYTPPAVADRIAQFTNWATFARWFNNRRYQIIHSAA